MVKKLFSLLLLTSAVTSAAQAATLTYGWEDGSGTVLGAFGNVVDATNVTGAQTGSAGGGASYSVSGAYSGTHFLHVAEEPQSGTPEVLLAVVTGLSAGDTIDAAFFGYDDTVNASSSMRIWAHYADSAAILSGDFNSDLGSAGGNSTYTAGTGRDEVANSWTFGTIGDALVIQARLYSAPATDPGRTDYWIDQLTVTAPDTAVIYTAGNYSPVPVPAGLWLLGSALIGCAGVLRRLKS